MNKPMKPPAAVLAEEMAGLDGYEPEDTMQSYHDEARQLIDRLNKRGVSLVRTNDVVMF